MAGYQAIGGITPYGQNYGQNYQNYAQQISSKYSTPNTTEKLSSLDCYSNNQIYSDISNSNKIDKKRQKKTALWITGGLLVTSTVAALVLSKGKNGSIWGKLKSGAKTCWEKTKNFFSSKPKTNELGDTVLDTVEMIQKNGKTTLRLPNETQKLIGSSQKIITEATELNVDKIAKNLTDDTSKITGLNLVVNDNGVEKLVTWNKSGKINCKIKGNKGININPNSTADEIRNAVKQNILDFDKESDEFKKLVNETLESIRNKKTDKIASNVKIENVVYDSKITDGTVGTYLFKGQSKGSSSGTSSVRRIVTDRFDVGSDEVHALMKDNKKLREAVEKATPTRKHWYNLPKSADYSNWNIRSATHTPTVKNWPENAHILIENNEIVGVVENGVRVNETRLKALQYRFPKAFEDVLDKPLDNVVRYL